MPTKTIKKTLRTTKSSKAPVVEPTVDALKLQMAKRSRKSQRTRRHLAEAAVALFEKKGFAATTVDEISGAADYSTSTFFRLFSGKEEVIFFDFSDLLEDLKAIFALPNHGNAWVTIRSVFVEFANRWDLDRDGLGMRRARLYHQEPLLYARFLAHAADWEVEMAALVLADFKGNQKQDLLSQVIAGAASAAFRAAFRTKLKTESLKLTDLVRDAFDKLEGIGNYLQAPLPKTQASLSKPSAKGSHRA